MILLPGILLILMFSIILHEVSHGWVALLNGDPTAKDLKRLTLNPVPHVDPVGTIVLPAFLVLSGAPFFIGWAKPVPYDPRNFKNPRFGTFAVALAGPLTNVLIAAVCAAVLRSVQLSEPLTKLVFYGLSLNVMLALFNLLPIPPLDGSKVLGVFLPAAARRAYFSLERYGFLVLILLMAFGFFRIFLEPLYAAALKLFLR